MKQTAVEFLIERLKHRGYLLDQDIEQAKAMEKEQILEALRTSEVELLSWGISAEQYYKENFKSE